MEFSRQEYWSGLPFPSPEIFLTQGLNPRLHLLHWQADSLLLSHQGSPAWWQHIMNTPLGRSGGCLSSAQPISKQCWGWIGPCAFYCDCKTSFTNTHQETLEKMKVSYLQDLETTQHSEALWQGERAWAFAFIEVKYFVGSLFIGEFKTLRVRTQSMGREKTSGPNGQEWKSARSPTQRSLSGRSREVLCQVWGWHRVYPERRH